MKRLIIFLFCFTVFSQLMGQGFDWAKKIDSLYVERIASGPNQGIYTSSYNSVSKFDISGNIIWTKKISGSVFIKGIACDTASNLYVTGAFRGPINVGGVALISSSEDHHEMFLAKFSPEGGIIWVNRSYGNHFSGPDAITIDDQQNPIITGRFILTVKFGPFKLSGGSSQGFVVKYSPDGVCKWAKHIKTASLGGGLIGPKIKSVNKNIYITGHFYDFIIMDSITLDKDFYTNLFLAKMDSSGKFIWAQLIGGDSFETTGPMDVDSNENIYLSGEFHSTPAYFGNFPLDSRYATGDNFIARYDKAGNCKWVKYGYAGSICAVNNGFYTDNPFFISKYDTLGNLVFNKYVTVPHGMSGSASNYGMAEGFNSIYLTGSFTGDVKFDNHHLSSSTQHMFIAKLSDATLLSDIEETEIADESGIWIYPNPTDGCFTLECKINPAESLNLEIKNILGQSILKETHIPSTETFRKNIDLGKESKGVYFIEISTGKARSVKKIVVN